MGRRAKSEEFAYANCTVVVNRYVRACETYFIRQSHQVPWEKTASGCGTTAINERTSKDLAMHACASLDYQMAQLQCSLALLREHHEAVLQTRVFHRHKLDSVLASLARGMRQLVVVQYLRLLGRRWHAVE